MVAFKHYSVLLKESVDMLDVKPDGIYVDCTLGGGGHSLEIAKRLSPKGRLIGIDRDCEAIEAAKERLKDYSDRITFVNDNFKNINQILDDLCIDKVDGAIADLGVSSYQLDCAERGFSFQHDAPLDMRMSGSDVLTARKVINEYSYEELKKIIYTYGEERYADRIAKAIVQKRGESPIETTLQLADIIRNAVPAKARIDKHPARKTFQAIRIEVNNELEIIPTALSDLVERLKKGGVISVITFHSLEDRAVKETFKSFVDGCTCPKNFPVCACGFKRILEPLTRKPVLPSDEEFEENSRSHSAKLRAVIKIDD